MAKKAKKSVPPTVDKSNPGKVKNKTIEMYIDNEGFLRITVFKRANITLKEAKENFEQALKMYGGKKMLTLVDARNFFLITKEARDFAASKETKEYNIAKAVVTTSVANLVMINLFLLFNRPLDSPLKVFATEKKALIWLRKFKKT